MTEEYVDLASRMMMHPLKRKLGQGDPPSLHPFPLERMSALAYLKSSLREPCVFERWSPYDIALFEAALARHGKEFFLVQQEIPDKTTQQVIEFYYVWKKTSHYAKWKKEYMASDESGESETTSLSGA